jgi:hypothetical protein
MPCPSTGRPRLPARQLADLTPPDAPFCPSCRSGRCRQRGSSFSSDRALLSPAQPHGASPLPAAAVPQHPPPHPLLDLPTALTPMYPNGGPIHARPEEARPEAGPSSAKPSGKAPLKRGSACRRCRLRKNRCTGERPVCGLCQKVSDLIRALAGRLKARADPNGLYTQDGSECVFDEAKTPRPASSSSTGRSRVSELEGKLGTSAQLSEGFRTRLLDVVLT